MGLVLEMNSMSLVDTAGPVEGGKGEAFVDKD